MLDRLMQAARETLRTLAGRRPVREPAPAPGAGPAPMAPVRPPSATNDNPNDNPLAALQDGVERALRAQGHLR